MGVMSGKKKYISGKKKFKSGKKNFMSEKKKYIIIIGASAAVIILAVLLTLNSLNSEDFFDDNDEDKETLSSLLTVSSPFETASDLDILTPYFGEARYVLLGESSHGTSEYYQLRADITKKLLSEQDFSFIALEGDWPYIYHANRYVKGYPNAPATAEEALLASGRWPQWMWANEEFSELVEWLREYNEKLPMEKRIGLYGIDMQNMVGSLEAALDSLGEKNPDLTARIKEKYACLQDYSEGLVGYAQAHAYEGVNCESEVKAALTKMRQAYTGEDISSSPELFNIKQNMIAVKYGERYARAMAMGGPYSWNTRVQFMYEAVDRLSDWYGEGAKGVVWAHNTHVGDARATDMAEAGMVNIGQLLREEYGEDQIYIVGFGTNRGTVKAGRSWGEQGEIMTIPPAVTGSIEDLLLKLNKPALVLTFDREEIPALLGEKIGHRAKGVVYNPEDEQYNYVPTVLPRRYNAFIFLEETTALNPIN